MTASRSALPAAALAVFAALLLAPPGAHPAHPGGARSGPDVEAELEQVIELVSQQKLNAAISGVERLIARHPNFRLAHLVRGDLLLARARPIDKLGNTGHAGRERLDELRAEAVARLRAWTEHPPADRIPAPLLWLDPQQRHAVVVDAARSRVYVYENAGGVPRLAEDYYTTIGKYGIEKSLEGDKKTPVGVYRVTSHISGAKLPDLYGWGAFPIDYPNEWDRRRGRTGYGIWLHGVPSDTYARAPWASDGCVALANPDIAKLSRRVQPGVTPVIIADRLDWLAPVAWRAERDAFMERLQAWRSDWESLDAGRYLAHYARDFRAGRMDHSAWVAHKRRVNAAKKWIRVSLENVSVFRNPGREKLVVVTFDQDYRSNNHAQRVRKRQYWVEEDGRWKIAYEAPVKGAKLVLPESFPGNPRGAGVTP